MHSGGLSQLNPLEVIFTGKKVRLYSFKLTKGYSFTFNFVYLLKIAGETNIQSALLITGNTTGLQCSYFLLPGASYISIKQL